MCPPPQVQSPYHINGMHQQDAQALRAACLQLTKNDTQQQHIVRATPPGMRCMCPPPQVQSPYHINGMHQQDAQALRAACLQLTKNDTQQQHPPPSEGSLQGCPVAQCPQHDPVRTNKNPSQVHAADALTSACLLCCIRTLVVLAPRKLGHGRRSKCTLVA